MDPFSTASAAIGLVDVCVRLVSYIHQIRKDSSTVSEEVRQLGSEIAEFQELCEGLAKVETAAWPGASDLPSESEGADAHLWKHINTALQRCHAVLNEMQAILIVIYGVDPDEDGVEESSRKRCCKWRMARRKRGREPDLWASRSKLAHNFATLQLLFGQITRHDMALSHLNTSRSFSHLRALQQNTLSSVDTMKSQLTGLEYSQMRTNYILKRLDAAYERRGLLELHMIEDSATSIPPTIPMTAENMHFDIPQPVSNCYVGREDLLADLQASLDRKTSGDGNDQQWRFVVQGIGGSGKTQFCSKFAWENRNRFWAVFKCNGASDTTLQRTLGDIARYANLAPDSSTALQWLSTTRNNWLLIVDGADDEGVDLPKYFPHSTRGHILISTRVPSFRIHGTIEPAFYDFGELPLSEADAASLLLRQSLKFPPREPRWSDLALEIARSLGCLALAICHAGAAIRSGLCGLCDFHQFYEASWRSIRKSPEGLTTSQGNHEVCALATWEMIYRELESRNTQSTKDALDLLRLFAFLHWKDVPGNFLLRAMGNCHLETAQERKEREESAPHDGWQNQQGIKWLPSKIGACFTNACKVSKSFPDLVQTGRKPGNLAAAQLRAQHALHELTRRSLIMHNQHTGTYTMHTIVHSWARLRPQMSLHEQCWWADAAARTLAASILVPPLGLQASDEIYNMQISQHVDHVQACRKSISEEVRLSSSIGWFPWLSLSRLVGREKLLMLGKFSIVYSQCGRYGETQDLLEMVHDGLCQVLGPHHPRSRRITILLAGMYWKVGKAEQASSLRRRMLQVCKGHYRCENPETFRAMGDLGSSLWQQGRFSDALELHSTALAGLTQQLGPDHPDISKAADQLGRTLVKFYRPSDIEEAIALHKRAVSGMERFHGDDHHRTLEAKQNLSRALLLRSKNDFALAEQLMREVLDTCERRFGEKAPETLIAITNMAIAECAVQKPADGEKLMRRALPVGEALYGSNHIAVLWGKSILGITLIHQGRLREAEHILVLVAQTQKHMAARRGDYHPDRIATLLELARCLYLQNKLFETLGICDEALFGLQEIGRPGHVHQFALQLRPVRDSIAAWLETGTEDLYTNDATRLPRVTFPNPHFLD